MNFFMRKYTQTERFLKKQSVPLFRILFCRKLLSAYLPLFPANGISFIIEFIH